MPSRREFVSALLTGAMLGTGAGRALAQDPGSSKTAKINKEIKNEQNEPSDSNTEKAPSNKKGEKPANSPGALQGAALDADILRESRRPPVHVPRQDTLAGIRRLRPPDLDLVVVEGNDPQAQVRLAIEAFGGLGSFLKKGDRVVITPNFAWAAPIDTGVTTCPEAVRSLISLCFQGGASEVTCLDYASDMTPRAFRVNGAYQATTGTGATLLCPWSPEQFVQVDDFQKAGPLHEKKLGWQAVPSVLLRADVFINMPVFKHHREVGVTGAMKKLMGCIWRRAIYHKVDLEGCIAELPRVLRPTLNVVDLTRILVTNGPNGPGKIADVGRMVVTADPVLADAFCCQYLDRDAQSVGYLTRAAKAGTGVLTVAESRIERLKLKPGG